MNKTTPVQVESSKIKNETVLKLDRVSHFYNCRFEHRNEICFRLGAMSLEVKKGEIIVVLGPSGSGKTTLLRIIAGLEWPNEGTIVMNDRIVFSKGFKVPAQNRGVGMVFQEHALFPHMTVKENICFGIRRWSVDEQERRLIELEDLLGLRNYRRRYPGALSGGQQQRVAIARTLAPKPSIVLLDEPFSHVDLELRHQLAHSLCDILKKQGACGIWVMHDQKEAMELADRIVLMHDGRIEQVDTPYDIYHAPTSRFVGKFFGQAALMKGFVKNKMIVTSVGTFACPVNKQNKESVEVLVRPENVMIQPHDAGFGTVVLDEFQGSRQLYTIRLDSGEKIYSYQSSQKMWPQGTRVQVNVSSENLIVF